MDQQEQGKQQKVQEEVSAEDWDKTLHADEPFDPVETPEEPKVKSIVPGHLLDDKLEPFAADCWPNNIDQHFERNTPRSEHEILVPKQQHWQDNFSPRHAAPDTFPEDTAESLQVVLNRVDVS